MSSPMLKKIGPNISERASKFYARNFATVNAGATYTLESFPTLYRHALLRELRGKFERWELLLMLDALNGVMLTPGMAGQHILADASDGIALDGLAAKWSDAPPDSFLARLQSLSIFQAHCLEIWCRAFWEQSGDEDAVSIEKWVEQLS